MRYLKNLLLLFSIMTSIISCSKKDNLFDQADRIIINEIDNGNSPIDINSKEEIEKIIDILNSSTKEPTKFKPKYKMELISGSNKNLILFNDHLIKYNSISYKVEESLYKLVMKDIE